MMTLGLRRFDAAVRNWPDRAPRFGRYSPSSGVDTIASMSVRNVPSRWMRRSLKTLTHAVA